MSSRYLAPVDMEEGTVRIVGEGDRNGRGEPVFSKPTEAELDDMDRADLDALLDSSRVELTLPGEIPPAEIPPAPVPSSESVISAIRATSTPRTPTPAQAQRQAHIQQASDLAYDAAETFSAAIDTLAITDISAHDRYKDLLKDLWRAAESISDRL